MRNDVTRFQEEQLNHNRKQKRARQYHGQATQEPKESFRTEHVDGRCLHPAERRWIGSRLKLLKDLDPQLYILGFTFKVFKESLPLFAVTFPPVPFKLGSVVFVASTWTV